MLQFGVCVTAAVNVLTIILKILIQVLGGIVSYRQTYNLIENRRET